MSYLKNTVLIDNACKVLFGSTFQYSPEILRTIKPEQIKTAYRGKVKKYHPDLASNSHYTEDELTRKFQKINNAYNILLKMISLPKTPVLNQTSRDYQTHKKSTDHQDFYYKGKMPNRELRFAEFLYYKKIISWKTLINALVWQYKVRPKIGELCKKARILTDKQIVQIIARLKPKELFGKCAVKSGFMNHKQLSSILNYQSRHNKPIGIFFIEKKFLNRNQLFKYLFEQNLHNKKVKKPVMK